MTDLSAIADSALSLEYLCGCAVLPPVAEIRRRTNWQTTDDVMRGAVCRDHGARVEHLRIVWRLVRDR